MYGMGLLTLYKNKDQMENFGLITAFTILNAIQNIVANIRHYGVGWQRMGRLEGFPDFAGHDPS